MKKLLLLLLLCPFMAMAADLLSGTITFKDGSTKTGLIDLPYYDTPKLKFKADKKAVAEKFSIDDIKEFTVTWSNNTNSTFLPLTFQYYSAWKKAYIPDSKKKRWVRIEREGAIDIATIYSRDTGFHYCLHKPGEDTAYYIMSFYGGLTFNVGEFKAIKKFTEVIFKDDCPALSESITKEEYKKRGLEIISDNYMQLCGDKNKSE